MNLLTNQIREGSDVGITKDFKITMIKTVKDLTEEVDNA